MYPQERYEKILALIEKTGFVRAADLNKLFNVSSETIRRDLENLEKEGFVKRVHGGATLEKSNKNTRHLTTGKKNTKMKSRKLRKTRCSL